MPTGAILRQMMVRERDGLFSDATIARCGAMIGSVARQLLHALAQESGETDPASFAAAREEALGQALGAQGDLLGHCHALAVESLLTDKVHERAGIDPVSTPLLKSLLAHEEVQIGGAAMHVLAAQARFMHLSRRMEVPLEELPAEIFHQALNIFCAQFPDQAEACKATAAFFASRYDEGAGRLPQMARLVMLASDNAISAMRIADAGIALFAIALAMEAAQEREHAVIAMVQGDHARLSLMLRAADMPSAAMAEALTTLNPQSALDPQIAQLPREEAAAMLHSAHARMDA